MNCKLCGISMYQKLTFANLFKKVGNIHENCKSMLLFPKEEILLPLENKYIIYHPIVEFVPEGINQDSIQLEYGGINYIKAFKNSKWSMMLYYDLDSFSRIPDIALSLLFALSEGNIWMMSIDKKLLYYLENIL